MKNFKVATKHILFYTICLLLSHNHSFSQGYFQYGKKLQGSDGTTVAGMGNSATISSDGNIFAFGGTTDNNGKGALWVYSFNGSNWMQQGNKLTGTGATGSAALGTSIAISGDGNMIIAGASADNDSTGAVWTFTKSGSTWNQLGTKLLSGLSNTSTIGGIYFGTSVTLSEDGKVAAIGAPGYASDKGAVFVYTLSGSTWNSLGNSPLTFTGAIGNSKFGSSISVSDDGKTIIAGGQDDNNGTGAAGVFSLTQTTCCGLVWNQASKLTAIDATAEAKFGGAVSMSGDGKKALIGGYNDNSATGAFWIFTINGTTWQQEGNKLVGSGNAGSANQGISVGLSSDGLTAVAGGITDNNYIGSAWVFTFNGSGWQQKGKKLIATENPEFAFSGVSTSISANGKRLILGATLENDNYGSVRIYDYSNLVLTVTSNNISRPYNSPNPIINYTITGFTGGDTQASLVASPVISTLASITSTGGNYPVTIYGGQSLKYGFVYQNPTITINKLNQTITGFNPIPNKIFGDIFTIGGITSSGLFISYSVTGPVFIKKDTVLLDGTGNVTITAFQIGDQNYNAAEAISHSFTISQSTQSITGFSAIGTKYYDDKFFVLTAQASSGLALAYSYTGPVTVSGNTVSITGTGVVTITAQQIGNGNYFAAVPQTQIFTILKSNQTITGFNAISNKTYLAIPVFTITGIATSGLAINFSISGPGAISGNSISITGAGMLTITASQVGNSNYNPAPDNVQLVTINKANQTILGFNSISNKSVGDIFTVSGIATSGLSVAYSVSGPAFISGNLLTVNGIGIVTVTAMQIGNQDFNPALNVNRSFISKYAQTIVGLNAVESGTFKEVLTLTGSATSGLNIIYTIAGAGKLMANIITITGSVGVVTVTAFQGGDASYYSAAPFITLITIGKAAQTISGFSAIPGKTYGDLPFLLDGVSSSELPVLYTVTGPVLITGNSATITGAGNVTITATQAGDANYTPASNFTQVFTINKATQTITGFNLIGTKVYGDIITLSAAASSGLAINYSVSGPAALSGNNLSMTGIGDAAIVVKQAGNSNYYAASELYQTFTILKSPQTITGIELVISKKPDDPPFDLPQYASSGLPVSYTVLGAAFASANHVTITGSGSVTIVGIQMGNTFYHPAPSIVKIFIVKFPQTITGFSSIPNKVYGDAGFTLSASATSGLSVAYTAIGPVFISGNMVSITGGGNVTITAMQVGNNAYIEALSVNRYFTVSKAIQTISGITISSDPDFGNTILTLTASSSSALPLNYNVEGNGNVANNIVFVTNTGILTITASQVGDANYAAAPPRIQTFAVSKLNQRISVFDPIETKVFGDPPFDVNGTASSGLQPGFITNGPAVVLGNTVSITGAGLVTITAIQMGNDKYYAASQLSRIFYVDKAFQSINYFETIPTITMGGTNIYPLVALASSELPVKFSVKTWPPVKVASVSGTSLYLLGVGSITITGIQPGNENFEASEPVSQSFMIEKNTSTVTGIPVTHENNTIVIYPNPSSGTVYVKATKDIESIVIYNMLGEEVFKTEMVNQKTYTLSKKLKDGIFLIKIDQSFYKLFIKSF